VSVGGYTLVHEGVVAETTPAKHRVAVTVGVYRAGRRLATLFPQKNLHWNIEQWVTEVAVRTSLKEDLYIVLAGVADDGSVALQVLINPLIVWLWLGGGLLLVGTTVAIWPGDPREARRE